MCIVLQSRWGASYADATAAAAGASTAKEARKSASYLAREGMAGVSDTSRLCGVLQASPGASGIEIQFSPGHSPNGFSTEEALSYNEVMLIQGESMVDTLWKNDKIPLLYFDANPPISFVANVKVSAAILDVSAHATQCAREISIACV